jgi:hypothetical protein
VLLWLLLWLPVAGPQLAKCAEGALLCGWMSVGVWRGEGCTSTLHGARLQLQAEGRRLGKPAAAALMTWQGMRAGGLPRCRWLVLCCCGTCGSGRLPHTEKKKQNQKMTKKAPPRALLPPVQRCELGQQV